MTVKKEEKSTSSNAFLFWCWTTKTENWAEKQIKKKKKRKSVCVCVGVRLLSIFLCAFRERGSQKSLLVAPFVCVTSRVDQKSESGVH